MGAAQVYVCDRGGEGEEGVSVAVRSRKGPQLLGRRTASTPEAHQVGGQLSQEQVINVQCPLCLLQFVLVLLILNNLMNLISLSLTLTVFVNCSLLDQGHSLETALPLLLL